MKRWAALLPILAACGGGPAAPPPPPPLPPPLEGSSGYYIGAVRPPPRVTVVRFGGYGSIPNNPASSAAFTRTNVLVNVGWISRTRQTTELVAHELAITWVGAIPRAAILPVPIRAIPIREGPSV
jgi:hypothetical protein